MYSALPTSWRVFTLIKPLYRCVRLCIVCLGELRPRLMGAPCCQVCLLRAPAPALVCTGPMRSPAICSWLVSFLVVAPGWRLRATHKARSQFLPLTINSRKNNDALRNCSLVLEEKTPLCTSSPVLLR